MSGCSWIIFDNRKAKLQETGDILKMTKNNASTILYEKDIFQIDTIFTQNWTKTQRHPSYSLATISCLQISKGYSKEKIYSWLGWPVGSLDKLFSIKMHRNVTKTPQEIISAFKAITLTNKIENFKKKKINVFFSVFLMPGFVDRCVKIKINYCNCRFYGLENCLFTLSHN